jgi:uncharacterized membrane protein YcaP (DUF421 family)
VDFILDEPAAIIRTVVVGVPAYLALILILRSAGKRTLSQMNAFDFIVTVALGSTLATILLSREVSLVEGIVALALLVGLQYVITWTSLRSRTVARLAKSEPAALVYRGQLLRDAMARERVLETELQAAVRERGLGTLEEADLIVLETDGTLSVIADLSRTGGAVTGVTGLPAEKRAED